MIGTDSLEESHFYLYCTTYLYYLPLQEAKLPFSLFVCALTFSRFSTWKILPSVPPGKHWELFIQHNNLCCIPSSKVMSISQSQGTQLDLSPYLADHSVPSYFSNSTWQLPGKNSSTGHELGSLVVSDKRISLMALMLQSCATSLADLQTNK